MNDGNVQEKSFLFAVRIVKLCKLLREVRNEYVLSKQFLRAGTSIGANISEAQNAQSRADFQSKMNIALKESSESKYWLRLLHATDYLSLAEYESIVADCAELERILSASIKTLKNNL